jgi:hypothetical protein
MEFNMIVKGGFCEKLLITNVVLIAISIVSLLFFQVFFLEDYGGLLRALKYLTAFIMANSVSISGIIIYSIWTSKE